MKIALTGAAGRIGNVLVRKLLDAGHDLRVLVRRQDRSLAGLPLERVPGDLLDPAAVARLTEDCEVLYHLAAVVSIQGGLNGAVHRTNVDGTRLVLETARQRGVRRVVYFSTFHVFSGVPADQPLDETRPLDSQTRMAYTCTKAEAQETALAFSRNNDLEVIALCPTGVLGPFDYAPSPAGQMLLDFYRGKIPVLVPGGVDWVDVRDVADAAVAALHRGRSGEAYILSGRYASVAELARIIGRVTGRPMPRFTAPEWLLRAGLPFAAGYARLTGTRPLYTRESIDTLRDGAKIVSCDKARRELGYSTRPLEDTIADAYAWFEQNGYLKGVDEVDGADKG